MRSSRTIALRLFVALLLAALPASLSAQLQTGNLYGQLTDNQGEPLPGARVTLTGPGAPRTQFTNAEGQFRFLGLDSAGYQLSASLEGFSTVEYPNVQIRVGRNTTLGVQLTPAVEEVISVTSESPLLDERKVSTGTTVSQIELEKIPSARDPWAVLQSTPGVLTDRVNVGGNASGQAPDFIGPGSLRSDAVWAIDGVVITDPAALGASVTYYDFDAFEEFQLSTGGSDASIAVGGVTLNLVTKRGTNEWRGSGRYLLADDSWDSSLQIPNSELGPGQTPSDVPERGIARSDEFGFELGGPVVRDKLWVWANYARNEIDQRPIGGITDFTQLEDYGVKLNAQLSDSNSAVGFYRQADEEISGKGKLGRSASPTRPVETTWSQSGPTDIWKLEDTHVFSSSFYLTGMASYVGGGFELVPQGGTDRNVAFDLSADSWKNSFLLYETDRPVEQYRIDASYFFNTGSTSHELRFGTAYRTADVRSLTIWPGLGVIDYTGSGVLSPRGDRERNYNVDSTSAYIEDTLTFGQKFTASVGLRYDLQEPGLGPATIRENELFPGAVPGERAPGSDPGFEWEDITPRVGLTYALGADRKTLLRASYARFAEQLGTSQFALASPQLYQYAYFYYDDRNQNQLFDTDELFSFAGSFVALRPDMVDPGFSAPITDQLLLGIERACTPLSNFSLYGRWSRTTDYPVSIPYVRDESGGVRLATRDDYLPGSFFVSGPLGDFVIPAYTLDPTLDYNRNSLVTNGPRETEYLGLTATFNKRLANRWMLRAHLTWNDWTNDAGDPFATSGDPNDLLGPDQNDGPAAVRSGFDDRGDVWINSQWSFGVGGLYQVAPDRPWGFNVALNAWGRQGYPAPRAVEATPPDGLTRQFQIGGFDDRRLDDIFIVDARIEKEFTFSDWGLTLSAEAFNLFNESAVLQREALLNEPHGRSDWVDEIVSPRIIRFGARINWR